MIDFCRRRNTTTTRTDGGEIGNLGTGITAMYTAAEMAGDVDLYVTLWSSAVTKVFGK